MHDVRILADVECECNAGPVTLLAIVGLVVQVLGVSITVRGFRDAYAALTAENRSIWSDIVAQEIKPAWKRFADRIRAFVRRLLRRNRTVYGSAQITLPSIQTSARVGTPLVSQFPPPLDETQTVDERFQWVADYFEALKKYTSDLNEVSQRQTRELGQSLRIEFNEQLGETQQEVQRIEIAAFGRDGKGLREAVVGLVITGTGIVMTIPALL